MRVTEVSMKQHRNERPWETGNPRENPPTSGVSARLPPRRAGVRLPVKRLPDFRTWEPARWPLVAGFSRGSPVSPCPCIPELLHSRLASPSLTLETSMLRATQTPLPITPKMKYTRDMIDCKSFYTIKDISLGQYQLRSSFVDYRPIMNVVKYRVVSCVVWTNRTKSPRNNGGVNADVSVFGAPLMEVRVLALGVLKSTRVRRGEYGQAQNAKGGETEISREKPADQRHHPAKIPCSPPTRANCLSCESHFSEVHCKLRRTRLVTGGYGTGFSHSLTRRRVHSPAASIFWISSLVLPFVSGTHTTTNTTLTAHATANEAKTMAGPRTTSTCAKHSVTTNTKSQLTETAIGPAQLRALTGTSSADMTHGRGPRPRLKAVMKTTTAERGSHPRESKHSPESCKWKYTASTEWQAAEMAPENPRRILRPITSTNIPDTIVATTWTTPTTTADAVGDSESPVLRKMATA
ncbi:hypothetical protein PR048_031120 [Dryococelus australis]|uniref:Uncharacterized protein n=1 Tax=Dryococelus australis TaxID=614101 RepID=A0ABQ9G4C4_9NEOP|nr:hypothetical protein PR048_031120 [Dryococelus australis]